MFRWDKIKIIARMDFGFFVVAKLKVWNAQKQQLLIFFAPWKFLKSVSKIGLLVFMFNFQWRSSLNFGKLTNFDQKLAKVQFLIPISKNFRVRKNLEVAVFELFRPLALQQKKPEVHPSNNFNFFSPKQQFVYFFRFSYFSFLRKKS